MSFPFQIQVGDPLHPYLSRSHQSVFWEGIPWFCSAFLVLLWACFSHTGLYVCLNPNFLLVSSDSLEQKVGIVGPCLWIHHPSSLPCVPAQAMYAFELGLWPWSLTMFYFSLDYPTSYPFFVPTSFFLCYLFMTIQNAVTPSFLLGDSHTFDDSVFRGSYDWIYIEMCVSLEISHISYGWVCL